jgi:sec-independent protein translocase protein TatB
MFGIEFPELVVIAVVALIVIGPEHLPKVARTIGHLWGRAQRYINSVKAEVSRDMALDELRKLQKEAQQGVANIELSMNHASQELEKQMADIENEVSGSKYELGRSIPENEISTAVLPTNELLKSEKSEAETVKGEASDDEMRDSKKPKHEKIRHEIIEEHHAVMPASAEQKKSTDIS